MTRQKQSSFALQGVRVLDLTNVIAGPVATRVLGQLGAEVIKVETPWGRSIGNISWHAEDEGAARPYNTVATFNEVNRAKLSIPIDLAHERGRGLIRTLASISDVLIENYSPRVIGNLGLTYESLLKVCPDLIMVSMPALGSPGPWSDYISFGPGTDALAGLSDVTGYQGGPPHKPGNFYADQNAAFHVVTAIMVAVWKRRRTGRGRHIKIVLREATVAVIGEFFLGCQLTGREPRRTGNGHSSMAPHNVYRCKGDDAWAVVAVASDEEWRRFGEAIGGPEWCRHERFATTSGRWNHRDELDQLIQTWTRDRTPSQVMNTLQGHGIKAGAIFKGPEMVEDPHYRERGFIDETHHPEAGRYKHPGLPWRFSKAAANVGQSAPLYAEHTEWVLGDLLGLGESDMAGLREGGTTPMAPVKRG